MQIEIEQVERLRFDHGGPVRAASAVSRFGDGFLVVQDDATHAAWFVDGRATAVRLLPPVEGLEAFDEPSATKHLKPDLEAACAIFDGADPAVLVMGSGSSSARMRWVLLTLDRGRPHTRVVDMTELYRVVAEALEVPLDALNLEGACVLGRTLRWFHRGLPSAGQPSASVDLDLGDVLDAAHGRVRAGAVTVAASRRYNLGSVASVGLAITDAVALPGHGVLCAAAAEDSPNTTDDGPVVASALVHLRDDGGAAVVLLPLIDGVVAKVEGLMLIESSGGWARLLAVVDGDDPMAASLAVTVRVRL
jgi:hypothetical protein